MKILGARCWSIAIPNSIQPGEYSMGGGTEGASYISDGNPNVLNSNRNDDGQWLNANWDHPDNQWNDNGAFAFLVPETLFTSPLLWWRSFALLTVLATHRAFYRPH